MNHAMKLVVLRPLLSTWMWFRDGLSENDTLEVLDLGWNPWKTKGAVCLAEGLAVINYANRK
jgi:hypothetical protein